MKSGYTQTRPNGKPVETGTLCFFIDPEDGSHPVYIYGKSVEEINAKLAEQNVHAERALTTERQRRATQPIDFPKPLTPDERMRATVDLDNPATSAEAAARLVEEGSGLDLQQLSKERFALMAERWEDNHPEFYQHKGNRTLMGDLVGQMCGRKLGRATPQMFDAAFEQLRNSGLLFEQPVDAGQQTVTAPAAFPVETQVQRTAVNQRRFATGARSTSFRAPQVAPPKQPKYTREAILNMPEERSRELIQSNDPDYEFACEYYFSSQSATA